MCPHDLLLDWVISRAKHRSRVEEHFVNHQNEGVPNALDSVLAYPKNTITKGQGKKSSSSSPFSKPCLVALAFSSSLISAYVLVASGRIWTSAIAIKIPPLKAFAIPRTEALLRHLALHTTRNIVRKGRNDERILKEKKEERMSLTFC